MTRTAFSVKDLTVFLQGRSGLRRILNDVRIDVRYGRTFALLGESGSGKTCLVHSVLGLHPGQPGVVAGSATVLDTEIFEEAIRYVRFRDGPLPEIRKDVAAWRRSVRSAWGQRLGRQVTLIPQDAATSLSPFHSVGRLLEIAIKRGAPELDGEAVSLEAIRWLNRVEMYDAEKVAQCFIHELSGGMAQRVAIALALAPGPELLIADEPTTGLDATLRISILSLLRSMVSEQGTTLIIVTHDNDAARLLASDVAVLYEGCVMETGPVSTVLDHRAAVKHPYTHFLLESERRLEGGESPRWAPKVAAPSEGCPFAPRCDRAVDTCGAARPQMHEVGVGHRIACFRVTP